MTRLFGGLASLFLVAGCTGGTVREDRAADWGRDGSTIAFQHDQDGVFVADKEGSQLEKIFEPDAFVLATSRPLYSPTDGRLIFTTAYALEGEPHQTRPAQLPTPPEGNVVWQRPVKYICWLRADETGEDKPAAQELFSASCDHIGYISAGLAVRWHPDGQRVLYLDMTPSLFSQFGIHEFDLKTKTTRCVFPLPHQADGVIFDFTPRGSQLVCVTGSSLPQSGDQRPSPSATGIWIGQPDNEKSWWKAPGSDQPAAGELPSLIESLRASRPAWTADDSQFAWVANSHADSSKKPARSLLQLTRVATRVSEKIYECNGALADLHWSPDGTQLGFVERRSEGDADLRIYDLAAGTGERINTRPVRKFAGFDRTGAHLAYVVPDEMGLSDPSQQWALLLIPNWLARDQVVVAPVREADAGTEKFSGMRVTFPVWSPTENRLSLWVTFIPRYQSLLSTLFRWGLLPGDPAATLDLDTGAVSWMAVTPAEQLQVGHYYLLKKDYARAWEWYERANQTLPPREPPGTFQEFTQTLGAPDRSQFFEYVCLTQLDRHDVAEARLQEFERNFFPADSANEVQPAGDLNMIGPAIMADIVRQLGSEAPLILRLIHDLYISEIFLSVDAPEAGIAFFREQLHADDGDVNRLSREMALSQLLLVAGRNDDYLVLFPELLKRLEIAKPESPGRGAPRGTADLSQFGTFACLAPAFRREFLACVPEGSLREAISRWDGNTSEIKTQSDGAIALFLRAAHLTLGNTEEAAAIETRLLASPAGTIAVGEKSIDEELRELFAFFNAVGQFAENSRRAPSRP